VAQLSLFQGCCVTSTEKGKIICFLRCTHTHNSPYFICRKNRVSLGETRGKQTALTTNEQDSPYEDNFLLLNLVPILKALPTARAGPIVTQLTAQTNSDPGTNAEAIFTKG